MNTEPHPPSEEPIDIGDLSTGGGGEAKTFGGLKLKGPKTMAGRQVTVVFTKGDWPDGASYPTPPEPNTDRAYWMQLQADGEDAVFQDPPVPGESGGLNASQELWDVNQYTGFCVYDTHITLRTDERGNETSFPQYPISGAQLCEFDSSRWPLPGSNGQHHVICGSSDGTHWDVSAGTA